MLDQQASPDRMLIRDLLVDHAYEVDEGDFDGLRTVSTDGARLDDTATGAIAGDREDMIAYLECALPARDGQFPPAAGRRCR